MPATWWLKRGPYILFIARELSSVFVAAYALVLLVGIHRLRQGEAAWSAFAEWLRSPLAIAFHVVALGAALLHSVTFFNLSPRALVVRLGEWRAPDWMVAGAHYAGWVAVSAVLAFLVAGG
jgi:fumarate reductase subunit C